MKKITRAQAEKLLLNSEVIKTNVKQDKNELQISMHLSINKSCLVKYNVKKQTKTYFIEDVVA